MSYVKISSRRSCKWENAPKLEVVSWIYKLGTVVTCNISCSYGSLPVRSTSKTAFIERIIPSKANYHIFIVNDHFLGVVMAKAFHFSDHPLAVAIAPWSCPAPSSRGDGDGKVRMATADAARRSRVRVVCSGRVVTSSVSAGPFCSNLQMGSQVMHQWCITTLNFNDTCSIFLEVAITYGSQILRRDFDPWDVLKCVWLKPNHKA